LPELFLLLALPGLFLLKNKTYTVGILRFLKLKKGKENLCRDIFYICQLV
jgi:hypothetical protein